MVLLNAEVRHLLPLFPGGVDAGGVVCASCMQHSGSLQDLSASKGVSVMCRQGLCRHEGQSWRTAHRAGQLYDGRQGTLQAQRVALSHSACVSVGTPILLERCCDDIRVMEKYHAG